MASCLGTTSIKPRKSESNELYLKTKMTDEGDSKRAKAFVLSRQMPPSGSSPPGPPHGDYMHMYLKGLLNNRKLSLNQDMYKDYENEIV